MHILAVKYIGKYQTEVGELLGQKLVRFNRGLGTLELQFNPVTRSAIRLSIWKSSKLDWGGLSDRNDTRLDRTQAAQLMTFLANFLRDPEPDWIPVSYAKEGLTVNFFRSAAYGFSKKIRCFSNIEKYWTPACVFCTYIYECISCNRIKRGRLSEE